MQNNSKGREVTCFFYKFTANSHVMVGWKINFPFQHKNRLYWGQDAGWRFSSGRL